jgi:hypothetical protein
MNKKQLQERIKKFVDKRVKEMSTGAGATSGATTGTGFQHTGRKPKNEVKRFQNPPKNGVGVPSVFTKGAKDLSAYKSIGYREVKPSEMIDAKYLWAGPGGLKKEEINESRYSQFKKQTEVVKPSTQMQRAIREIKKKLQEANKIVSYTKQLKSELSETSQVEYNKRTEVVMNHLMREVATLYQNLKQIKENGKGKNIVD